MKANIEEIMKGATKADEPSQDETGMDRRECCEDLIAAIKSGDADKVDDALMEYMRHAGKE